jgi:predicted 3-demethylubiquinone-9 3-methyltransferase (glyoxalase superfamily)
MKTKLDVRHISVSINRPANEVYEFASKPENLPQWATGLGGSIRKVKGEWTAHTPMGKAKIRFAEKNQFGILDHDAILESGVTFHNPMRVLPNGRRSEVIFTLFRLQKITPHLWFDKEAKEAAKFYTSLFPNSKIKNITTLHDTPSGDCDVVSFELSGQPFMAISAGPLFKFNPSVSFIVNFDPSRERDAREKLDALWNKLIRGGMALMPLQEHPFSKRYGWLQDKYGLSWQVSPTAMGEMMTKGTPEQMARVTEAFLKMKKFDIAALKRAYKGV